MKMDRSYLRRDEKPKYYPHRRAPLPEKRRDERLKRHVPAHPGRFPVGLDHKIPLFPPRDKVRGTPLSIAAYVGRVEQIDDAEVTVRVWARPSGWEGLTTFDIRKSYFERTPAPGDLLWVWTWIEASKVGANEHEERRVHIEVESREPSEDELEELRRLLAEMENQE